MTIPYELIPGPFFPLFHRGPKEKEPLPCFFYFALNGLDSLTLDPYAQVIEALKDRPIRCFSITLPSHENTYSSIMQHWQEAFALGQDPFKEFFIKAHESINYLITEKWIDPTQIALGGLSRGALFSCFLSLQDARYQTLLNFAPLLNLQSLKEFEKKSFSFNSFPPSLETYNLLNYSEQFITKTLRFYIGNRDLRVNTDFCYHFIRSVADKAYLLRKKSGKAELIINHSIGHLGHGTALATFQAGALWLLNHFAIKGYKSWNTLL